MELGLAAMQEETGMTPKFSKTIKNNQIELVFAEN